MNVVALVSGGKDSCFAALKCIQHGHTLSCLANLYPSDVIGQRDSFMYQTQGYELLPSLAECMALPLERRPIQGSSLNQDLVYEECSAGDEVEDLYQLLCQVKRNHPSVNAVCSGAVLSTYQRTRVENVCQRLGLLSLAYLWNRDQSDLLDEMIKAGMDAVLVKACSMGLDHRHCGKSIAELQSQFHSLEKQFGFHVCGEGGEYETLTLNAPANLFPKGRIVLDETDVVTIDAGKGIYVLNIVKHHIEAKDGTEASLPLYPKVTPFVKMDLKSILPSGASYQPQQASDSQWFLGPFSGPDAATAMNKFQDALQGRLDQVCMVHLYLRDLSEFGPLNDAFSQLYTQGGIAAGKVIRPPARATIETRAFHGEDHAISITALLSNASPRKVLHVQSRSEWAPQCIGPYSQCNLMNDTVAWIAGQIPLHPPTMVIPDALTLKQQLLQALQHVVAVATDSFVNARFGRLALVYVSNSRGELDPVQATSKVGVALNDLLRENKCPLPNVGSHPVIFVCIPRLPKDAALEVEYVACTKRNAVKFSTTSSKAALSPKNTWSRVFVSMNPPPTQWLTGHSHVPVEAVAVWSTGTLEFLPQLELDFQLK